MYASELMELARKNPEKYVGKQYKVSGHVAIDFDGVKHNEISIDSNGELNVKGLIVYINTSTKVEEIKKPVTFIEAVEACEKCLKVSCEYKGNVRKFTKSNRGSSHGNSILSYGWTPSIEEILYGTWYIESEDE